MAKAMKITAAGSCLMTLLFALLYCGCRGGALLTLAITFGTIAYHFCIRLLIGLIFSKTMRNKADYTKKWFQLGRVEKRLYDLLKVKAWKNRMPTYDGSLFDAKKHSWDEIAQATCQAELVHETIIVFSFLPIAASVRFGALPVFVITSVCAALFDSVFVIMQRYNRPRIVRMAERQNKKDIPQK